MSILRLLRAIKADYIHNFTNPINTTHVLTSTEIHNLVYNKTKQQVEEIANDIIDSWTDDGKIKSKEEKEVFLKNILKNIVNIMKTNKYA